MLPNSDYVVLKISDVRDGLSPEDVVHFAEMIRQVELNRENAGKPKLECVVIESEWPEYRPVLKAIEKRAFVEAQLYPDKSELAKEELDRITKAAMQIGQGPLMEYVAVPNPRGGFYMQARRCPGQIEG